MAGVHAGIKKRKSDLALIALPGPHVCAQVITTNEIKAAPLLATSAHLDADGDAIAAIVCNAGCANACTGERGLRDAENTARHTATLLGVRATQVVVASTGVIGVTLPMDRLAKGLDRAHKQLVGRAGGVVRGGRSDHDDRSRAEARGVRMARERRAPRASAGSPKARG